MGSAAYMHMKMDAAHIYYLKVGLRGHICIIDLHRNHLKIPLISWYILISSTLVTHQALYGYGFLLFSQII